MSERFVKWGKESRQTSGAEEGSAEEWLFEPQKADKEK